MTTVRLEDILEQIEPEVRLAGSALILQKLRDVSRDFCQFTRAWQWDAPLVSIVAGQKAYNIITPGDAEPVVILYMSKDNSEVYPKDTTWLDRLNPGWRTANGDDFRYYTQETRNTFRFPAIPVTSKANAVFYRLALKPGATSEEIDEDLWQEWYDVLGAGAKAGLMMMSGKPWTDLKTAAIHSRAYLLGRARARIRYDRSFTDVEQSFNSTRRFA